MMYKYDFYDKKYKKLSEVVLNYLVTASQKYPIVAGFFFDPATNIVLL